MVNNCRQEAKKSRNRWPTQQSRTSDSPTSLRPPRGRSYGNEELDLQNAPGSPISNLQTRQRPLILQPPKWTLIQLLYQRGWEKQRIIDLFVVLDWMMRLPRHLTEQLWQDIELLEEKEQMRYVSSIERIANENGMQQGVQQGEALALRRLLAKRFGTVPSEISSRIASASREQIGLWFDQAIDAPRLEDVFGPATH
jgi:hypothetical protein